MRESEKLGVAGLMNRKSQYEVARSHVYPNLNSPGSDLSATGMEMSIVGL